MTLPKALARRIDKLSGSAHSYALDYVAWWMEGGREPKVDDYVWDSDDDSVRRSYRKAQMIAAYIREAVRS